LEDRPVLEAARFAMAASGYVVTRYGSQAAFPTREELERFMDQLGGPCPA
jgi:ribokinase